MALPHFIIIGAMKCATTTLHRQLALQPGIFMSEPKETSFFSDDEVYAQGIDWYASLFDDKPSDWLLGESSTHYTKLPTYLRTAERMRGHLTDVRLIYVMRDPIDRLVSQYLHEWSRREVQDSIDVAVGRHPELLAYSRYAMQLEPFMEAYGADRILPVFFERLVAQPDEELARVCAFLGYRGTPSWQPSRAAENRSSDRLRTSAWRDALVRAPVLRSLRRTLVPKSVRSWIRRAWQPPDRPELSAETRRQLSEALDPELESLGRWLGIELDCAHWTDQVLDVVPRWAPNAPRAAPRPAGGPA